jgi:Domain of Unknown Function (DUF349)
LAAQEYGYIKDGKVYRTGFLEYKDREIGKVVDSEESAIEYFQKRFSQIEGQFESLSKKIEAAVNKGSFLGHIKHLKSSLGEFDGIGDFESISKKLNALEEELQGSIKNNRVKNLEIKRALLIELKVLAISKEWKAASHLVKELQHKWSKTGAVDEEFIEEVEVPYKALIQGFYDNRAAFYADLDKMMKEREAFYHEFLKKAEMLREIPKLAELRVQIKTLMDEWKELGHIQRAERDKCWEAFQKIIQESLDKAKKEAKKITNKNPADSLKDRKQFLVKLNKITTELHAPFNVNQLKTEWSKLGSVSKKEMDAMRQEYGKLLLVLSEASFVTDLAKKKLKKGSKPDELIKMKIRLMRDLLERDKRELKTFNENLGNFSMAKGLDKIIGNKLELQEKKVEVKQYILEQFRKV